MDRVEHLESSSYTTNLTIVEGTVHDRQPFTGSHGLDIKADGLGQQGTLQRYHLQLGSSGGLPST